MEFYTQISSFLFSFIEKNLKNALNSFQALSFHFRRVIKEYRESKRVIQKQKTKYKPP